MKNIKMPTEKSFGYTISSLLGIIILYRYYNYHSYSVPLIIVCLILLLITITKPDLLKKLNYTWTLFGYTIGKVTNPIILSFVYFGLITPINIFLKICRKDILNLNFDYHCKSYWIDKKNPNDKAMKVQF